MIKKALITGCTGQDGYFLTKLLLSKGYEVNGMARRNSQMDLGTVNYLSQEEKKKLKIYWGDITDPIFMCETIGGGQYNEIYHLAAQSFVGLSFTNPKLTYDVNIGGTLNIVNAIKQYSPHSKLYFAATSEMFGNSPAPQNEETPMHPRSPYGVSKLAGYWTVKNYRESYGLFMCNGILFNHESEMRGPEFVTRKITKGVADIVNGKTKELYLGNLDAKRDWGYAGDYVEAMWLMLQQDQPDDYVIGTGETHSVREFVEKSFECAGLKYWQHVMTDNGLLRPAEVNELRADASKAMKKLGWNPKIKIDELVKIMIESDLNGNKGDRTN